MIKPYLILCDDNLNFVDASRMCLEDYAILVKRNQDKAKAELAAAMAKAKGQSQEVNLETTKEVYSNTNKILGALVNVGEQAKAEMQIYLDSFVAPFDRWSDFGEGSFAGATAPKTIATYSKFYCFGESYTNVKLIMADLEIIVAGLKKAQEKTSLLLNSTSTKVTDLSSLDATLTTIGGSKNDTEVQGVSRNQSDISKQKDKGKK